MPLDAVFSTWMFEDLPDEWREFYPLAPFIWKIFKHPRRKYRIKGHLATLFRNHDPNLAVTMQLRKHRSAAFTPLPHAITSQAQCKWEALFSEDIEAA